MEKICSKCKVNKPISEFRKRSGSLYGVRADCKECCKSHAKEFYKENSERIKEQTKEYAAKNKEKISLYTKDYRYKNKDCLVKYSKMWREENKESIILSKKKYYEENKSKILLQMTSYRKENIHRIIVRGRESYKNNRAERIKQTVAYKRKKRQDKNDPIFTCAESARNMLRRVVDLTKSEKTGKSFDILGYTAIDLKKHLESMFIDDMSWANHGKWHIDHIVPVAMLVSHGITDPKAINSLKNLRPLWAKDNLKRRYLRLNNNEKEIFQSYISKAGL